MEGVIPPNEVQKFPSVPYPVSELPPPYEEINSTTPCQNHPTYAYQNNYSINPMPPQLPQQYPIPRGSYPIPVDPSRPVFVPGIEVDAGTRPTPNMVIPPPPPGYAPNQAQLLAQSGYKVQLAKSSHDQGGGWKFF